jgi:hypothetical protein
MLRDMMPECTANEEHGATTTVMLRPLLLTTSDVTFPLEPPAGGRRCGYVEQVAHNQHLLNL